MAAANLKIALQNRHTILCSFPFHNHNYFQRIIRIAPCFALSQSSGNSHPRLSALCAHFRFTIKNIRMVASKLAHPYVSDSDYALMFNAYSNLSGNRRLLSVSHRLSAFLLMLRILLFQSSFCHFRTICGYDRL